MKLTEVLDAHNFERSMLIGYYGGGNYGDELLLEILMNLFSERGVRELIVTYQHLERYQTFHQDFGYRCIDMADKRAFLRTVRRNKNIIIGGGGLWGLDVNVNIFALSLLLFISRRLLGKKVYLLGVGYYDSTNRLGRLSAFLAGKAATLIIARDEESLRNFGKLNKRTYLDTDIAWLANDIKLSAYDKDVSRLERYLKITGKTLFITLRRFKINQKNSYTDLITRCLEDNQDKRIIVALMEPETVDPEGYALIKKWQKRYPNVQATDFSYNPLALFLFFRKYHDKLALIGPQFHTIITAQLARIPFLPIAYDNKVNGLFKRLKYRTIPIANLSSSDLQSFINKHVPRT